MNIAVTWGSTEEERDRPYPCDEVLSGADLACFRAVDVRAPAAVVFRWLCQLRVAPYSYDWIDNLGRQSPRQLTPGLDRLEQGQTFMTIFRLVGFEAGRSVTLEMSHPIARRIFGPMVASYTVVPSAGDRCRIVVKLLGRRPRPRPWAFLVGLLLSWADLVMMRKQLRTLAMLAEGAAQRAPSDT